MSDDTPRKPDARQEFLTARQLADILQVSESTVRRLARTGRIPSIRLTPRIIRFHLPSVRQALDGNSPKGRAQRPQSETQSADNPQLSFIDLL